jgi:hypothetical protein
MDVMVPHDSDGGPLTFDKSAALWTALNKERGRVAVEICYCSTLGDCWILRSDPNSRSTTTEVTPALIIQPFLSSNSLYPRRSVASTGISINSRSEGQRGLQRCSLASRVRATCTPVSTFARGRANNSV